MSAMRCEPWACRTGLSSHDRPRERTCQSACCTPPVPLEYSIERPCAFASSQDAVMAGWPGAAQDRLPAGLPATRPGCPGVP